MLHWYLLAKDLAGPHRKAGAADHFAAMHGQGALSGLSRSHRARLVLLGGIETLPSSLSAYSSVSDLSWLSPASVQGEFVEPKKWLNRMLPPRRMFQPFH